LNFHSFDKQYLQRLASRDPFVEEHFTAYFSDLLLLKLRTRLRSPQLIEDARQETLLRVLQAVQANSIDHPERFGAYVSAVCSNVLRELLRHRARHDQLDESTREPVDESVDLDEPLVTSQRKREVERALAALAPKDRDLLRMFFLEERDKTELCRLFNVTEDYLRVVLHRAKSKLRTTFAKQASTVM